MKIKTKQLLFIVAGWFFVALGFIGIFLPLLPTTPFAILAAYFFSKGSPRLHQWLIESPYLGPLILDWEKYGVIRLKAKILATTMIVLLFSTTLIYVNVHLGIKVLVGLIGVSVLLFIWTRPSTSNINKPS